MEEKLLEILQSNIPGLEPAIYHFTVAEIIKALYLDDSHLPKPAHKVNAVVAQVAGVGVVAQFTDPNTGLTINLEGTAAREAGILGRP